MALNQRSTWSTHDFRVKTLEGSIAGAGGSRLGFTCRTCGRKFSQTPVNHHTWAVNELGAPLDTEVSDRWLSEECGRHSTAADDDDRRRLRTASPASRSN
jgi:hypothetical protein